VVQEFSQGIHSSTHDFLASHHRCDDDEQVAEVVEVQSAIATTHLPGVESGEGHRIGVAAGHAVVVVLPVVAVVEVQSAAVITHIFLTGHHIGVAVGHADEVVVVFVVVVVCAFAKPTVKNPTKKIPKIIKALLKFSLCIDIKKIMSNVHIFISIALFTFLTQIPFRLKCVKSRVCAIFLY